LSRCTFVVKPSEHTPASTLEFARLFAEAGFPPGVFNVVTGYGPGTGGPLVGHRGVDKVAFTGSTATGIRVMKDAADHLARVSLELGGKSPNIVFADADEGVINGVVAGIFAAGGQTCIAGSRLFVEAQMHDEIVSRLTERARAIKLGDPLKMETEMGPAAFKGQQEKIKSYIDIAQEEGASSVGYGQVVDVALYEAVFAITESLLPEYDGYGIIRQRTGNILPGLTPSNIYACQEDKWVVIGGNADGVFKRLMQTIGRADLAEDPRFVDNPGRTCHQEFLDGVIADWTSQYTLDEVMETMNEAGVPAGPIYDAADIMNDPHFNARAMIEDHEVSITPGESNTVRFPGIVPKLSETPGETQWLGPALGAHNEEVYGQLLGFTPERLEQLKQGGII